MWGTLHSRVRVPKDGANLGAHRGVPDTAMEKRAVSLPLAFPEIHLVLRKKKNT